MSYAEPRKAHKTSFETKVYFGPTCLDVILRGDWLCTPFQRHDWLCLIQNHLLHPGRHEPFVVALVDVLNDVEVLLLPMMRTKRRLYTAIEVIDCGVCDYLAPLIARNSPFPPDCVPAAWNAIVAALPSADIIQMDGMPASIAGYPNPFIKLPSIRFSRHTSCGMDIFGDESTVLHRSCDPSFVKKLGKTGRRLEKRGKVSFVEARSPQEVDEIYEALAEQRRARFKKLKRFDLLAHDAVSRHYREAAHQGLTGGAVRLLGLRVGDTWVGTYYGLLHNSRFQGVIVTIAGDEWKTCSPGLHVHAHVIRWAIRNGAQFFDMSVGPLAYKDEIGGQRTALYKLSQSLSFRGGVVLSIRGAADRLKDAVRRNPFLFSLAKATLARMRSVKAR